MRPYLPSLALAAALLLSGPIAAAEEPEETRIVSGTIPCKMAYQVLLDADGKALKGRLYPEYSDCAAKLLLKYPGLTRRGTKGREVAL